ncbi:hypothetical protein PR003_g27247 [Phytophthora rubi]|uniref:Tc1-like transposase DDE domain-containing protein n=1 Tax=Phytophthora rubi TaxID=129364 RepID=A0A6A4BZW7_9STRA|nr:hypothetical protein PR001_g26166 [Phytophthora rubi]KAE9283031.1 hypothetical protein PR003_g27247 [Phytophthora rubi]
MTYHDDFRWRAIALLHVYDVPVAHVSELLGPKQRTIRRWYSLFLRDGIVNDKAERSRRQRWPDEVLQAVKVYVQDHPTFYIEELRDHIVLLFPELPNVSTSTICRVLNFDLNLSRKVLSKAAREAVPAEIEVFRSKLRPIYSFAEQLVFIDETAKDGRHAYRRYGWSRRNTKAVVKLPFRRGKRLSIMEALDVNVFFGWDWTEGTFTRGQFHDAFVKCVVPHLNPWPLPRSIVIMDNAKIHAYPELETVVHACGARLLFVPPYCPQLNPIEPCFGLLKRWL